MSESVVPTHLGLILDGNRRWARAQGLPTLDGHKRGYENLRIIAEAAFDRGVSVVSAFVFSTENWDRSKEEVSYLMKLLRWVVTNEVDEMHRKNIRVCWLGSKEKLDSKLIALIQKAEALTTGNTRGTLALCLNHGGHREIADAVKRIIGQGVIPGEIDEKTITANLDHPEIPPCDLIIRTSGEQRLSNFMLWRAAYSEFIFRSETWPDFTVDALDECLLEYKSRQRRFGG